MKPTAHILRAFATRQHAGAAFECIVNVFLDNAQLSFVRHCADVNFLFRGVVLLERTRLLDDQLNKLRRYRLVYVTSFYGGASLAGITEGTPDGRPGSALKVCIRKNDHRIFTAELEDCRCQMFRCGAGDPFTCCYTAREYDLVNAHVDQRGSRRSFTGYNFHQAFRRLSSLAD